MSESLLLLVTVAFAALASPGPMTMSLAAIGASYGVRQGTPFLIGAILGLGLVGSLSALGASALIMRGGPIVTGLFAISVGYFAFVAFKIAASPISSQQHSNHRVPSFWDAILLNLTNPKAYLAFLALYAGFALPIEPISLSVAMSLLVVFSVGAFVDTLWLFAGGALSPLFSSPKYGRPLRFAFAAVMVVALGSVIWATIRA